jgi:hypothetical protein
MKKYTVTVRDNEKQENVVDFDSNHVNYSMMYEPKVIHHWGGTSEFLGTTTVKFEITGTLPYLSGEEAIEVPVYFIDDEVTEEITDCRFGHSWISQNLFTDINHYCKNCGVKKDEAT